jgi:hypothetical protein
LRVTSRGLGDVYKRQSPTSLERPRMMPSRSFGLDSWSVRGCVLAVIIVAACSMSGFGTAFAQKEKPTHTSEERAQSLSGLKQAFSGSLVDVYFEMGELESQKPGLAGVKFVDVVDVTGKELLRFERSGDSWLIDPDTVFAYKLHKSK